VGYPIHVVDVFTETPLAGNQLAVVLDASGIHEGVMQRVAREMNLSETTFVLPPHDSGHAARVRIFTPGTELPFAGHPTVGTAWVLFNEGLVPGGALEFTLEEAVGPVPVRIERSAHHETVWMTHPEVTFGEVISDRAEIAAGLGLEESDLVPNIPLQVVSTGNPFLFVALKDPRAVDAAVSEKARLSRAFGEHTPRLVFLFTVLGPDRIYGRMFGPHVVDIPEDPATGSAAGPLGAFAVRYGLIPKRREVSIVCEQGTKMGRQSFIHIKLEYVPDQDAPHRIEVGGSVVPVLSGTLVAASS
jgi:trans-2,3-dihydro-3-hydroxyanthranilate isomerase